MTKHNFLPKLLISLCAPFLLNTTSTAAECNHNTSECMTLPNLVNHLKAFQQFADNNSELPGTRFVSTSGYDDTRDYIAKKMQDAGYQVSLQDVHMDITYVTSPRLVEQITPDVKTYQDNIDYAPIVNSGGADITAALQLPAGNGCNASDYSAFKSGNITLIQIGDHCDRNIAIQNAIEAGAKGIIVSYRGLGVRYMGWNPASPTISENIPILASSNEMANELKQAIASGMTPKLHIQFKAVRKTIPSHNIIAESQGGDPNHVVMVGAHIDSSHGNAGMNDNASSAATVLETALLMKNITPIKKLRFAWWTGEELGLIGSNYYVEHLSQAETSKIAVYLNFEVLGAPNGGRMIMGTADGVTPKGSEKITQLYVDYFKSQNLKYYVFDPALANAARRSDMFAFMNAGIPVGFIITGAELPWNPLFDSIFTDLPKRVNGLDTHPCYHKACDKLTMSGDEIHDANFDFDLYLQMSKAAAHAVYTSAM